MLAEWGQLVTDAAPDVRVKPRLLGFRAVGLHLHLLLDKRERPRQARR